MAVTYLNAVLGWVAVGLITLLIAGLFYVDVSARRLLARLASADAPDAALRSAAEDTRRKGFWVRLSWLRSMQASLRGDASTRARMTLRIYSMCWVALVVLFVLWVAAMLMPKM